MTERISRLFDYGDEIVVDGLDNPFDPAEIVEMTREKLHGDKPQKNTRVKARRVSRILALAAMLSTLFATGALAAGLSIHSRRQAQLHETLTQGREIAGYTEFGVPAEETPGGVTVLAAISDGEFELLWLNVAPVEEDEVPRFLTGIPAEGGTLYTDIGCRVPADESVRGRFDYISMIAFEPEDWVRCVDENGNEYTRVEHDTIERRYREQFYDPETKTLTVCLRFPASQLTAGTPTRLVIERVFRFVSEDGGEERRETALLGETVFTPVGAETLTFMFPEPYALVNPETGGRGEIRGIELTASGVNTFVWYEDAARLHPTEPDAPGPYEDEALMQLWISWSNAIERVLAEDITLNFSDGSTGCCAPVVAAVGYEDGVETLLSSGRHSLWDIHSLVSVTVGENTYKVPRG